MILRGGGGANIMQKPFYANDNTLSHGEKKNSCIYLKYTLDIIFIFGFK